MHQQRLEPAGVGQLQHVEPALGFGAGAAALQIDFADAEEPVQRVLAQADVVHPGQRHHPGLFEEKAAGQHDLLVLEAEAEVGVVEQGRNQADQ